MQFQMPLFLLLHPPHQHHHPHHPPHRLPTVPLDFSEVCYSREPPHRHLPLDLQDRTFSAKLTLLPLHRHLHGYSHATARVIPLLLQPLGHLGSSCQTTVPRIRILILVGRPRRRRERWLECRRSAATTAATPISASAAPAWTNGQSGKREPIPCTWMAEAGCTPDNGAQAIALFASDCLFYSHFGNYE